MTSNYFNENREKYHICLFLIIIQTCTTLVILVALLF